jgi:heme exporter protein D
MAVILLHPRFWLTYGLVYLVEVVSSCLVSMSVRAEYVNGAERQRERE